ncbi:MAG: hypothetical protein IT383_00475 [Deltaproteobacteria bacterium]|nr:hypothetical protein [Deltaproteobacteria bacterium]
MAVAVDDFEDDLVIVGGLVPTLLIEKPSAPFGAHVGTMDLDVGLHVAVLDDERYAKISERMRSSGLNAIVEGGKTTRQKWRFTVSESLSIDVDFLIPGTTADIEATRASKLQDLESDFAAIITPGLRLAFADKERRTLTDKTLRGEDASRDIYVCGPASFTVLKALAFRNRADNKDAYDLCYVLRAYGARGPEDVAEIFRKLPDAPQKDTAIEILKADFATKNSVGIRRAVEFERGEGAEDDALAADLVGAVALFVQRSS